MRLGQWMDWGDDYFTFSDTNIEYIWRFLKLDARARAGSTWATARRSGARAAARRSPQHELSQAGVYQDRSDPSLYVRFPLLDRDRRVRSSSGRRRRGRCRRTSPPPSIPTPSTGCARTASGSRSRATPTSRFTRVVRGAELVGLRYDGPFDTLAPGAEVEHRVIPWDEVSLDEGTGIVHIAPGCGAEDFELSQRRTTSPCSRPSTSRAASTTSTAGCTASRPARPPTRSSATSASAGCSSHAGLYRAPLPALLALRHAAHLPDLRRLVHRRRRAPRSRCSTRTRPSSGRPRTWASAWTTGSATWATGTSRAAATTACRSRSTRARAAT